MNALIIGVGGLGCPAALGLARAGVRRLTLVDPDRVDVTNLHRQILYSDEDVGFSKAEIAAQKLRARFPGLEVDVRVHAADAANADALFRAHDVVIDGTDGTSTKFLLNDVAVETGVPLVHGGALRLGGQAMRIAPGGPCLRCLWEDPPAGPTCASAGVLGPVTGVVGALQAALALRGDAAGALFVVEGQRLSVRKVPVRKASDCRVCAR